MAIVNQNDKQKDNGMKQGKKIDPANLASLRKGEVSSLDAAADAWETASPPPAGYYAHNVIVGKEGYEAFERQEGNPDSVYYKAMVEAKIISTDKEINGSIVFINVSTFVGRGKKISTMAGLMMKSNKVPKLPSSASDLDVLKMFVRWVALNPIIYTYCDWQAWSQKKQTIVRKGMESFPQDEAGGYIGKLEIDGEEITAKLKAVRHLNKKEFEEAVAGAKESSSHAEVPMIEEEEAPTAVVPAKQIRATTTVTKVAATSAPAKKTPPKQEVEEPNLDDDEVVVDGDDEGLDDFIDDDSN